MLQPGGEGGTLHYQQLFGNICPSQVLLGMNSREKQHMGLKSGKMSHVHLATPHMIILERGKPWKRENVDLTQMLSLTGNPSDLSGKLQGENIVV